MDIHTEHIDLDDWELLARLSQVFRNVSDVFADQVNIPRGQAGVLCVTAEEDGLTQSEIAERLFVQGATITTMLQKLEEVGLVVRSRDPEDNRLVRVHITESGLEKERGINQRWGAMQKLAFKGLSLEERALLRRWLLQIIENMGKGE